MYTFGRVVEHAKLLCSNAQSRYSDELIKLCAEDALVEFHSRKWPFMHGEGVITTTPMYNTGTVTANNGNTTITVASGTWDTTWPTPAIIRIDEAGGEEFLVTSFDTSSTLTIDTEWPFTTGTTYTYTLEFPAYDIPSYMEIDNVMTAYAFKRFVTGASYGSLMEMRHGWLLSGYPGWYTIIPGNGTRSQQIWISPTPNDEYTIRYTYKVAVPDFFVWNYGTASVTASNNAVTGSTGSNAQGTNWNAVGETIVGKIFEITDPAYPHPYNGIAVGAVGGATSLTLASNWDGRTVTSARYSISSQITMPDDCIPMFRSLVESYVYARIGEGDRAAGARQIYTAQLSDSLIRYERDASVKRSRGVNDFNGGRDADFGPGFPTELVVT
jgi:hypothetical protein